MALGPWAVQLRLPGIALELSGLSDDQVSAVVNDYWAFLADDGVHYENDISVICRVELLPESLCLSPVHGHGDMARVATVTSESGSPRLEIKRNDFHARISKRKSGWNDQLPIEATLGLASEDALVRSGVIGIFLRILVAHVALARGGILLHSSGIVSRGHAYLFSGRSNVGKTTLARKAASKGFAVLSDDVNVIIPENGVLAARKVPGAGEFWRQKLDMSDPGAKPLGAIVLLEQAPELYANRILRPAEAVAGLITGCFVVNDNAEAFPLLMDVLTDLVERVPIVRVGVALSDSYEAVMEAVEEQLGR